MTSLPQFTPPTLVRPNYQQVYDYRLTNAGINIYRVGREVLEISLAEFADFMGLDFVDATWLLAEPDEDFSYYCGRISDYISSLEISNQETI